MHHLFDPQPISLSGLKQPLSSLTLSASAKQRIQVCRDYLDQKLLTQKAPIYGINTGFGSLYNKQIASEDLRQLQLNLMRSHACGMGDEVSDEVVRWMLLLKARSLSLGYSGAQVATVERLIDFYEKDILPVVYTQGSLGASGDLAPLAHLCLPLIGEGEVKLKGVKMSGGEMLQQYGWQPLDLSSKEGLALLNGTQFMSAHGVHILLGAARLSAWADTIGALSLDAFDGRIEPFDALIHQVRPHPGQVATAAKVRELIEGSELIRQPKAHVQDPYAFRCIPQVHGASKDAIDYATRVFEIEINSVSDNPNIFPNADKVISGGNFHGQPLALALDFLAIALAELGSISERRTYQLISGTRGLPPFLAADPGLNSGLMIPQYTAASIVSQNKQFCTPSSIDTIPSSNNQEDHVSMGANGAVKCLKVLENVERILAIELLTAAQALEFRRPKKTSPTLEKTVAALRENVSFNQQDRYLRKDIEEARKVIGYRV